MHGCDLEIRQIESLAEHVDAYDAVQLVASEFFDDALLRAPDCAGR